MYASKVVEGYTEDGGEAIFVLVLTASKGMSVGSRDETTKILSLHGL